jgi:hypothetical protein
MMKSPTMPIWFVKFARRIEELERLVKIQQRLIEELQTPKHLQADPCYMQNGFNPTVYGDLK